jgi:RHS repeat-associated protein
LDEIQLGGGGVWTLGYDLAGNQNQVASTSETATQAYDDAGRLTHQERAGEQASSDFAYDGRSFLRHADTRTLLAPGVGIFCDGFESGDTSAWMAGGGGGTCFEASETEALYDSEALLLGIDSNNEASYVFYFGRRPVAQTVGLASGLLYLTTDPVAAPALATDASGTVVWSGGFEPYGGDYSGAGDAGIFLRFMGQWQDSSWEESGSSAAPSHYNVHRWYQSGIGRYIRPDPIHLGILGSASRPLEFPAGAITAYHLAILRTANPQHEQPYLYGAQNPLIFSDPLGLFGPGTLATAGGACIAVDGPLPAGDLIGIPLLVGATVWTGAIILTDWWANADACSDCELDLDLDEEDECDRQYALDSAVCRTLPRSLRQRCWEEAARRYAACLSGQEIPEFLEGI